MAGRPWFGPKRYGWGFTPISWQGWVLTGAYVAAVFVLAITLATTQPVDLLDAARARHRRLLPHRLPDAAGVTTMERTRRRTRAGRR